MSHYYMHLCFISLASRCILRSAECAIEKHINICSLCSDKSKVYQ